MIYVYSSRWSFRSRLAEVLAVTGFGGIGGGRTEFPGGFEEMDSMAVGVGTTAQSCSSGVDFGDRLHGETLRQQPRCAVS